MDYRFMAYPYLKETSRMCDYEIATDELASMLGYATHLVKHCNEIHEMIGLVYHLNGSIRGRLGIDEDDLKYWNAIYDRYQHLVGTMKQFVLPTGCVGASYLHVIRCKVKAVLRIVYAIDQQEKRVNPLLTDILNLLSNLIFYMCLYENEQEGVVETMFVSKSYGN